MQTTCPRCGQPIQAGQRFCSNCGYAVALTVATPPPGPAPAPPPVALPPPVVMAPAPRRRGCCSCSSCLLLLVVFVILLAGSGGVLYLLISNGTISQHQIRNTLGIGTGEISVANLSDDTVTATLTELDAQRQEGLVDQRTLKTMEIQDFADVQPGLYKITIPRPDGSDSGACTVQVVSGDVYSIVLVRTGSAITREKEPAQSQADLAFPGSALCQR